MSHGIARSAAGRLALCLGLAACAAAPSPRPIAAAAVAAPQVRLRLGDGLVLGPVPHPAFVHGTILLRLPACTAQQLAAVVVERQQGEGFGPWLEMAPVVAQDGTLRIAGLAAGQYRFLVRCGGVGYEAECRAEQPELVEVVLRPAMAQPLR